MINKFFSNKYILPITQFVMLGIFASIIIGAIGITTDDPDFAKVLRNTNLSNLIVWSYWWPLIIVTAIIFGRFWCTICPIELVTSFFGKIGLKRKPGKFLKSGWVITLFYAAILIIGIHTLQIHRIPNRMAFYMLTLFVVAIFVGLVWEKRTFCTYVCPVGHLLGLYSLLSFLKLRVASNDVCKQCNTKDCVSKSNHYNFVGRSCTSELFPPKIKDNKDCILCGQCFKSCPNDNLSIKKQRLASDLFTQLKLTWAEISFFVVLSGFVVYEILSEWKVSKGIIMLIPDSFNEVFLVTGSLSGSTKAIILFVILPFLFFIILALMKKVFAGENLKAGFTQLVLAILPITASMHILKSIFKTTSRIPYWDYVFADPTGVQTAGLIINDPSLIKGNSLIPLLTWPIGIISIILPVSGLLLSYLVINKQMHQSKLSKFFSAIAVIAYFSIFFITLLAWKWL